MGGNYSMLYEPGTTGTLTAAQYAAEHQNHIDNMTPDGVDDASVNSTAMQTTADPYPSSAASLATDLRGELPRLRYMIQQMHGNTYWYQDAAAYPTLYKYRRPRIQRVSATTVDVESGIYTGTSGDVTVLFPDGKLRTVNDTTKTRFDITRNCSLSGTKQSGLRSTLSEATNTWYALYEVVSTDDDDVFVTVGDTVLPLVSNFSTLASNFNTDKFRYAGLIRNGNNANATGDILDFLQCGDTTLFLTICTGMNAVNTVPGTVLATTAGATSLTYTYSAGTGTTNIPGNVGMIHASAVFGSVAGSAIVRDSGDAYEFTRVHNNSSTTILRVISPASSGIKLSNGPGSSIAYDLILSGFTDAALAGGPHGLI